MGSNGNKMKIGMYQYYFMELDYGIHGYYL